MLGVSSATWEKGMPMRTVRDCLAACLAFAMGLQDGTFTRAGKLVVRSTHVTGTMLNPNRWPTSF